MTKKRRKSSKDHRNRRKISISNKLLILPFLIGAGLVPVLVRGIGIELYEKAVDIWPTMESVVFDFFSWQKAIFIVLSGVIALFLIFLKKNMEGFIKNNNKKYLIPVFIYIIFVVLSTVFSKYPKTSINGFVDRYEGAVVLLAYMTLFIASMYIPDNEERIRKILWGIVVCSFAVLLIGAFQFFNMDLFKTDIGKRLILNSRLFEYREHLEFSFKPGFVYSTLFNPNYVGGYCAVLFPVYFGLFFYEKKLKFKLIAVVAMILALLNLYGSESTAGIVGLIAAVLVIFGIYFISKFKNKKVILISGISLGLVAVLLFILVNVTDYQGRGILGDMKLTYIGDEPWYINDMTISSEKIVLDMNQGYLEIRNDDGKLSFIDENKQEISVYNYDIYKKLDDPRFANMQFKYDSDDYVLSIYPRHYCGFSVLLNINGFYSTIGFKGVLIPLEKPRDWFFEGYETMGSSRGYIWSRSIPLIITKSLFIGTGPDTYAYIFPQNDIKGKMNSGFESNVVLIDKPHNMYIQAGINTGLISMLALMALFMIFIIDTVSLYIKLPFGNSLNMLGLGLSAGCIGYMVTGIFNDSTVSTSSMFWVLLGCSIILNQIIKIKSKKDNEKLVKSGT